MAATYTVTIPTKPHIKSFIASLYGNPVRISNSNSLGVFLIGILAKKNFDAQMKPGVKGRYVQQLTDEIICTAPLCKMAQYGHIARGDHFIQVNRYFESIFEEHLYFWVLNRVNRNKRRSGYQEAIESFMDRYNLHETVNYWTLQKIEYRYREELKKNINKSLLNLSTQKTAVQTLF
jgi:hypothetical protein